MTPGKTAAMHPFSWRPTPTIVAGVVLGATVGVYMAGPLGALVGPVLGGILWGVWERFVDVTAARRVASNQNPRTEPAHHR
jgi:hypothetical protein